MAKETFSFEEAVAPAKVFSFEEALGEPAAANAPATEPEVVTSARPWQGAGAGRGGLNDPRRLDVERPPESSERPIVAGAIGDEAGQLRDEVFSGVDQSISAAKNINASNMARRLQKTQASIQELERKGQGDSAAARRLRGELQSLNERLPATVSTAAEANADSARGSQMVTRPAIQKVGAAKTFGEAWEAFKEAPYDVIAGVTAQSLPQILPGLIAGIAAGPAAGAVTMGLSSGATEFGSSLGEFARERGVDIADKKALQAFYSDPAVLSEAMTFAGTRAGIIGTVDAVSGGIAGKTLAPAMRSKLAQQAVNVPAQMGVQAAAGAGGEAAAQLATKGAITEPGQVLMEAAGELGGAPAEIAAFSKDARDAILPASRQDQAARELARELERGNLPPGTVETLNPNLSQPAITPKTLAGLTEIGAATSVDEAIIAAARATTPQAQAVDNIGRLLGDSANVSQPGNIPPVDSGAAGTGAPEPGIRVEAGVGASGAAGPALDTRGVRDQPAGGAAPLAAGRGTELTPDIAETTRQIQDLEGAATTGTPSNAAIAQPKTAIAKPGGEPASVWFGRRGDGYQTPEDAQSALPTRTRISPELDWRVEQMPTGRYRLAGYDTETRAPTFTVRMNPTGTATVLGNPKAIAAKLAEAGITKVAPNRDGVTVATSQAQAAAQFLGRGQAAARTDIAPAAIKPVAQPVNQPTQAQSGAERVDEPSVSKPFATTLIAADKAPTRASRESSSVDDLGARPEPTGPYGRDLTPVAQGGKPFKTKAQADAFRKQYTNNMRTVKQGAGFVLRELTAKELAAREKAAKRIAQPRAGQAGAPISAHEFVVGKGGLARGAMADAGFDRNMKVGNRWLFAGADKPGLTLAEAAELLAEAGYIREESETAAADIIKRSMTSPQYTADGWERIAEAEQAARFEDHLAAQQDSATEEDPFGPAPAFTPAEVMMVPKSVREEYAALMAAAEEAGIDTESILEEAARIGENWTQEQYSEYVRQALTDAIANSRREADRGESAVQGREDAQRSGTEGRSPNAGRPGDAPSQADEGLTARSGIIQPQEQAQPAPALREPLSNQEQKDNEPALTEPAETDRYAAGKALTKEQRKQVLGTLVDVYKAKDAPREQKGIGPSGNERYGYVHSPELFEKSDITGAMVRYYVTLPDGRIAHPSELFPDFTQAQIDTALIEQANEERREKDGQAHAERQADTGARASPAEADAAFMQRNRGFELRDWRTGKTRSFVHFEKDGRYYSVLNDDTAMMRRIEKAGWTRTEALTAPTQQDVLDQQQRREQADELDQREQIQREASGFQLQAQAPEKRRDTTGDLLGGLSADDMQRGTQKLRDLRDRLRSLEDRIVGAAGMAPGFLEDALRSRKVSPDLKAQRETLRADIRELAAQLGEKPVKLNLKADDGTAPLFSRGRIDESRDLIIQHNLTAENLLHAERMGGIPVPSLAITKAEQPLENFGEITLLGDADMATPRGDMKVFGADIYSPRYPNVQYKPDAASLKKIKAVLEPFRKEGEYALSELRELNDLTGDKAFVRYADSKVGGSATYAQLKSEATKLAREAGAEERIFQGFTYSGNRKYKAHTLDNVIAILKKELRGGENFNYGAGSLRAKFTPQFRTIQAIRNSKDRLITTEAFEKVKDEINKELLDLTYNMVPNGGFRSSDTGMAILEEGARIGMRRAAKEYDIELSDEQVERANEFLQKLRNLPTAYFEAKALRAMDLSEFKVAVVPDNLDADARRALEKRGVKIVTYPKGDAQARRKAIAEASADNGLLFSRAQPFYSALDELSQNDDLFALPKSDAKTLETIAAETDPSIKVRKIVDGLATIYILTMPNGTGAKITVRKPNPYGASVYGFTDAPDGGMEAMETERPGTNPEDVPPDTEDVYTDVSLLKEGQDGARVYNIAATFAHNTGRIFIGDPAGLSDVAMRRRTEHMLSSALKFGTTKHLAPHPRQVQGDKAIGVPPMRWTYGDDAGNIESLIRTSLDSLDYAEPNPVTFEPTTGRFLDRAGRELDERAISSLVGQGSGRAARAGSGTLKRNAILRSLLRQEGGNPSDRGGRVLAELLDVARQYGASTRGIFYSRGTTGGLSPADAQTAVDALKAAGLRKLVLAETIEQLPDSGKRKIKSENATGVRGMYDPATDTTYLVRQNLASMDEALMVGLHEAFHRGLRKTFGSDVQPILDLIHNGNVSVQRKTAAYMREFKIGRTEAIEEVLADMAGQGLAGDLKGWDKLLAFLRDALGKIAKAMGVKVQFTDDQITDLVAGIRRAGMQDEVFIETATPQTETKAFKDWFAGSKVVDDEGKPLVVYHGTNADFDTFKPSKEGAFGPGVYFTDSRTGASDYSTLSKKDGANVVPAYLSITKPLRLAEWEIEGDMMSRRWREKIRDGGYDGLIVEREEGDFTYVAFRPEQIKSALGNNGNFDPKDPDIRFSRTNAAQEPEWWQEPGESKLDKLIYEIQDGRIDLKRVQEAIKATGKDIAERFDARMAETLYPGRVARRTDVFLKTEVRPLLQAMALGKIGMDELGDYLIARHAPERNAQVAKVNPDLPDGGAGRNSQGELMTDNAAAAYLAALSPEKAKQLAALAKRVDSITAGTRELLVGEGLEKPETVKAWTSAYKNYVPLFKDEAEHGHPIGTGFNLGGSASKRSTGSTKEVTNVLAHVLMQREAVITRAEKNRVGLALYGLALSHPNKNFWTVVKPGMSNTEIAAELQAMGVDPMMLGTNMDAAPTIRTVDTATNQVVDRPNPMYKKMDGAITLKVAGEDRVLLFNEKDERALRLATNLKNMDGATAIDWSTGVLHEYVSKTIPKWVAAAPSTRWLASVNTQYNIIFGLVNVVRDVMGGTVNLTSTPLRKRKMQVLGDVMPALKGIARDLRGGARTEWSDLFNQFQDDGGQTGFKEMFRTADDRARAIEKELQAAEGKLTVGKAVHAVLDLLDDFNTALENAVRLSAYKAALDEGMSRPAAAKLARELTVDFNRKGRTGREFQPIYAFLNASIQGTARTVQTLAGPAGAKIVAGGLAIGGLQALMLAFAGFDEDEPPEWVKTRGLIIPIGGDKRYIVIPLALGLHAIPNTGRVLTELALYGGNNAFDRMGRAIGEIAGAFNPLGGGNIFTMDGALRTVMPTVIDPFIELGFNKNFAGSEIEKRPFNEEGDNRPGFQRARESTLRSTTGQAYLGISKAINTLTGGNDFEAGAASPTPERIRYLAQTVGGGLLREMEKAVNVTTKAGQGDDIASREIPMAGRFVGQIDPDMAERARYFEASNKIKKYASSLTAAEKAGADEIAGKISKKYPEVELANTLRSAQERIRKLNKNAAETINDRDELARIDRDRFDEMKALNAEIKAMERLTRGPTLAEKIRGEDR